MPGTFSSVTVTPRTDTPENALRDKATIIDKMAANEGAKTGFVYLFRVHGQIVTCYVPSN